MLDDELNTDEVSDLDLGKPLELIGKTGELMDHTQAVRLMMIRSIAGNDYKNMRHADDDTLRRDLIKLLEQVDKQEVVKARLELDAKAQANDENFRDKALAFMAQMGGKNPFLNEEGSSSVGVDELVLPELEDPSAIEGSLEVGEKPVSYEEVMSSLSGS